MTEYVLEDTNVIIQRMVDYFRTAQTKITDFNEGSETRNLLSSIGVSAYEIRYYIDQMLQMAYPHTASGDYLDMIGVLVNCFRKPAVQSIGNAVFSLLSPVSYDIDIPKGTLIGSSKDLSLSFETIEDATLTAGQISVTVSSICQMGGTQGNIAIRVLDNLTTPIGSLNVTNTVPFSGGESTESDGDFRVRILTSGKANITGSISWYKTLCTSISGVHDVVVINNPFGNLYSLTILINGNIRPLPDAIITDVEALFQDEDNIIGGISVEITKPNYAVQNIIGTLTIDPTFTWSTVLANVESNIACYFNGGTTTYGVEYTGLSIGDNIVQSRIEMIIGNTAGILDFNLSTPNGNVMMANDTSAQLGSFILIQS